jgi:hypothetical protein
VNDRERTHTQPTPRHNADDQSASGLDIALSGAIVALTLATAYIHLTLGGLQFTLTAFGYAAFAIALMVRIRLAEQFRWLLRFGLIGYTLAVVGGWVLDGARYDVAYLTKAIEVALIALLAVDLVRREGNPIDRLRDAFRRLSGPSHGRAAGRP